MAIPDEKARSWTRPEDYWPPRRLGRSRRHSPQSGGRRKGEREETEDAPRPLLGTIPYFLLMISLGILALAIMIAAWPGARLPAPTQNPVVTEVGTAPRGWMDGA